MTGRIIKGIAGFYLVEHEGMRFLCKARGILRKDSQKPLVGDRVEFEAAVTEESEASITEIADRRNVLLRPAVSNVDQVLIVLALKKPDPQLFLLDEYLLMVEKQGIPAGILWNKADLAETEEWRQYAAIYESAGYPVFSFSSRSLEGLDGLKAFLKGKITVLAGPSGVGKSTLTNLLCPDARMETGEISRKISRGKQTTRHTELFPMGEDSYLLDTPGFTSVFVDADQDSLRELFPEFWKREGQCRYSGCRHLSEPDCSVKAAVASGEISGSRYESYRRLMKELSERRRYG